MVTSQTATVIDWSTAPPRNAPRLALAERVLTRAGHLDQLGELECFRARWSRYMLTIHWPAGFGATLQLLVNTERTLTGAFP